MAVTSDTKTALRVVKPNEHEALLHIANHVGAFKWLWADSARANPLAHMFQVYAAPGNLVFDVCEGQGVIAFCRVTPNWRAQVHVAYWGDEPKGKPELLRSAATLAMQALNVKVIDAFVALGNVAGQRCSVRAGMRKRGIMKNAAHFDGEPHDLVWYEIDRPELGLKDDDNG
jgi:RimJ/RimL family protein N-acetyltransferase